MVTVKLVSSLKKIVGFDFKEFAVTEPTRIRDLLQFELPDESIVVIINDTKGGTLDTYVSKNDKVLISPVFGGG